MEPDVAPELVVVVVPARDEEEQIGTCLAALALARGHPEVREIDVRIIVVLDSCTDGTAVAAMRHLDDHDEMMTESVGNVGAARRAGLADALRLADEIGLANVWLATSDADTIVGSDWLARQLRWRARGFDGVAGTVRVDSWRQYPTGTRGLYDAHVACLGTGPGHPHVHGANLGFSAHAYSVVGGMPAIETGEDQALWKALDEGGFRLMAADDLAVVTSGRMVGRAPDGFAGLLGRFASLQVAGELELAACHLPRLRIGS